MNFVLTYREPAPTPSLTEFLPTLRKPWESRFGHIQRKDRIGSHMPKHHRNRNGKRYYKGGGY